MKTEQRSLRLSRYYLSIVGDLQEKYNLSFTDAIKHVISEYAKIQSNYSSINRFIQKLDGALRDKKPSNDSDPSLNTSEILDELNELGSNIRLILKALLIIGSADSRTVIDIEKLLGGRGNETIS